MNFFVADANAELFVRIFVNAGFVVNALSTVKFVFWKTTSPFFVAFAYIAVSATKYPSNTVTPKEVLILNDFVVTASNICDVITSCVNVSASVPTFASAVTSTFVSALSNTIISFTWYPFPTFVIVIVEVWSLVVLETSAVAPNPT